MFSGFDTDPVDGGGESGEAVEEGAGVWRKSFVRNVPIPTGDNME